MNLSRCAPARQRRPGCRCGGATSAFVVTHISASTAAVVIGLGAGALCYTAVWLKTRVRLDDSLDVWAIHGEGGIWGMLATGLFIGVGFMTLGELTDLSRGRQVLMQLMAIGWAFITTLAIPVALKYTIGLRVDERQEEEGLDLSHHGEEAYDTRP